MYHHGAISGLDWIVFDVWMDIAGQGYPFKYLYPGLKVVISGQFCTLLVNQYKQPIYSLILILILIIDYFDLHRQDFSDIEI